MCGYKEEKIGCDMNQALFRFACHVLGVMFIAVGIQHFTNTAWFEPIVPDVLGNPTFWVWLTGVMEIGLGLGLLVRRYRRRAALLTAVFLVGVYWANLNMWVNNVAIGGQTYGHAWHVGRLFAQLCMIGFCLLIAGALDRKPLRWDEPHDA